MTQINRLGRFRECYSEFTNRICASMSINVAECRLQCVGYALRSCHLIKGIEHYWYCITQNKNLLGSEQWQALDSYVTL